MINRPFKFSEPKKPSIWNDVLGMVLWLGLWSVLIELVIRAI